MNVLQKLLLQLGRVLFAVTGGKRTHRIGHLVSRWMPNAPQPVVMGGYVLLLDLHHASDLIRAWGVWEEGLTRYLKRSLEPGMTFVDVGAHHGTYSIMAAAMVGSSGQVHAFEPFPESAALLRESVTLNGFSQVTVHEAAAADENGECAISVTGPHIVERRSDGGEIGVRMATIDSLVPGAVDLVKVDTDGSEERVLDGMKEKLLAGTRVIVEVSDFQYQSFAESLRRIVQPLAELGYVPELIRRDGSTTPFQPGATVDQQIHLVFSRQTGS